MVWQKEDIEKAETRTAASSRTLWRQQEETRLGVRLELTHDN